jgi:hypothetical protein
MANSLSLIDVKSLKLNFCFNADIEVDRRECAIKCKRDCIEENYHTFSVSNDLLSLLSGRNKTIIRFESRNIPFFQYKFEAQYSFVKFISNIGGILSLWFGFAISDIYIIIKKMMIFIKIISAQYLFKYLDYMIKILRKIKVLNSVSKVIKIFKQFIKQLDKYNIRLLVKFLCIPYFFYQVIEITQVYLYFATKVNVELNPILNDGLISMRRLPALTVCHESNLKEFLSNDKELLDMIILKSRQNISDHQRISWNEEIESMIELSINKKYKLSFTLKFYKKSYPKKYRQILEFMINYMKFSNNNKFLEKYPTISEMEFFSNHFECYIKTNETLNCDEISQIVPSFSFLGKCNTFQFKSKNKFESNLVLRLTNNKNLLSLNRDFFGNSYMKSQYYIHSFESKPSLSYYDWINSDFSIYSYETEFREYNFKRLEFPYDTNCRIYQNETQSECLNECYIREQISTKKCINKEEFSIMFNINTDRVKPDIPFCSSEQKSENYSFLNRIKFCSKECQVSCEEQLFIVEHLLNIFNTKNLKYNVENLNFHKSYYTDIIHSPDMLFTQYIIGVANLLSLWHGIYFTSIVDMFFNLFVKLIMKTKIDLIFEKIIQVLMNSSFVRIFVIILLKTLRSTVKSLQVYKNFFYLALHNVKTDVRKYQFISSTFIIKKIV